MSPSTLAPHFWTLWPFLRHAVLPVMPPPSEALSVTVDDPQVGPVPIGGRLRRFPGSTDLVVLVHGLAGCSSSRYLLTAAAAAEAVGISSLRVDLRGADRGGADFYHAGLTGDFDVLLEAPELAEFERVFLLGFSLGGHQALRYATEDGDPRLRAVAAVCSPLDLARGAEGFDSAAASVYRRHILRRLAEIYEPIAARLDLPASVEEVRRARTIREFDRLVVVPRHGFRDVDDYYARASVGPRLGALRVPALLLAAEADPMVTVESIRPAVLSDGPLELVWRRRGGHVCLPGDVDLGVGAPGPVEVQLLRWLLARGGVA